MEKIKKTNFLRSFRILILTNIEDRMFFLSVISMNDNALVQRKLILQLHFIYLVYDLYCNFASFCNRKSTDTLLYVYFAE